jgi:uncharacterized RDD family membrane protein YckC
MNFKISLLSKRFFAFLIDFFVLNVIILQPLSLRIQSVIPEGTAFGDLYSYFNQNPTLLSEANVISILIIVLFFSYFFLLDWLLGQTLGKKVMGLVVVSKGNFLYAHYGTKVTIIQAFVRNLALLPLFPFVILWIVDPFYLVWKGKRVSDHYTKTDVVSVH